MTLHFFQQATKEPLHLQSVVRTLVSAKDQKTKKHMLSFTQFNFSKGAAVAMVLFACLFLIGLFYLKLLSKEEEEG